MFLKMIMVKERILNSLRIEKGAVAFEYVLIIGGVSAVVVGALAVGAPGLFGTILTATCASIATIPGFATIGAC